MERCERERPSARRRASQVLSPQPIITDYRQIVCDFSFLQDLKDETHIVKKDPRIIFPCRIGSSGRRTLRICREFVRLWMQYFIRLLINPPSRLRRATSFSKEANEAVACCMGSFGKGAARRAED